MSLIQSQKEHLEERMLEVTDFYRGFVMDIAEQELGSNENWQFVRGRLLKALGDRGLVGKLREVIADEFRKSGVAQ